MSSQTTKAIIDLVLPTLTDAGVKIKSPIERRIKVEFPENFNFQVNALMTKLRFELNDYESSDDELVFCGSYNGYDVFIYFDFSRNEIIFTHD